MLVGLTGNCFSRQLLKLLTWLGFSFLSGIRVSPMNSLCRNLSSSHTEILGEEEEGGGGRGGESGGEREWSEAQVKLLRGEEGTIKTIIFLVDTIILHHRDFIFFLLRSSQQHH